MPKNYSDMSQEEVDEFIIEKVPKGSFVYDIGHGIGLDDIYSSTCTVVTMYGYSMEGETSKRTLEQPDITGLQKMYSL